ncbi:uncharacterized protein LOC126688660 isoform X1 [Quercus robur]|uniref:uncharacterized protein LOC126688660 isoform X1 n=1 Tax=Quercus robur TaxID=38942 RepID=UPI00216199BB|nr:uncharacterized protein LOC126688660 isoform X1 [Quercus robur]
MFEGKVLGNDLVEEERELSKSSTNKAPILFRLWHHVREEAAKGNGVAINLFARRLVTSCHGIPLGGIGVFASAFSGFRRKLFDLNVDDKYLWAQALTGLQTSINSEIRNLYSTGRFTVLKELEAVNTSVKKLYPMIQDGVDFQRD